MTMSNKESKNQTSLDRRQIGRRMSRFPQGLMNLSRHDILLRIPVLIIVILLAISVLIVDSINRLDIAWKNLNQTLIQLQERPEITLTQDDFDLLYIGATEVLVQVESARSRVGIVAPILRLYPDTRVAVDSLNLAYHLSYATINMLEGIKPFLTFVLSVDDESLISSNLSSGQRIVEQLEIGQVRFLTAAEDLQQASKLLDSMDVGNASANIVLFVEQIRLYHAQLQDTNQLFLKSPELLSSILGIDQERSYLILAQNNDEIRPSGGFISTYGLFTVRNGRIVDFDYSPSTPTSPNPPPDQFAQTFEIPDWWIHYDRPVYAAWDGSWHTDFLSTARLASNYYTAGNNPKSPVDGVIAIDISGLELLLGALGEVPVPAYDRIVTQENFREVVYDIRAFGRGKELHKEFLVDVYSAIQGAWRSLPQEDIPDLVEALLLAAQQKHLLFYFENETAQEAINLLGWSGQLEQAGNNDYLLVADANLVGNKSNHSIIRTTTYDVEIRADGSLQSRLGVQYDYFDSLASEDPAVDAPYHGPLLYVNVIQVLVPQESTLIDTKNLGRVQTLSSDNHTTFVARVRVEYDSSERFYYVYETKGVIEDIGNYQRYRLLLQKQAGTQSQQVNIQVRLPENAEVIHTLPEANSEFDLEQQVLDFRFEQDSDQWLEVIYQVDARE